MGSWWDDFSNNFATDLAPLVALFGESPTKQYLSECLTIEDIIIFATAPMGVITAVVSAIRVCGTPSLRAFIGKAQEGAGTAEAELCSSTSRDVCELYNNGGIARVFGRPKLLEIVHDTQNPRQAFFPDDGKIPTAGIYSFKRYIKTEKGKQEWVLQSTSRERKNASAGQNEEGAPQPQPARFAPNPNLSLNIGIKPHGRFRFIFSAVLGVTLQAFLLVWACLTRYYFKWLRKTREDEYAIPLMLSGTVLLCLGMALCAHLIESKTEERVYQRVPEETQQKKEEQVQQVTGDRAQQAGESGGPQNPSKMYWVQPGNQNMGDQIFDSFGYSDGVSPLQKYITSWKDTSADSSSTGGIWPAVGITSLGFLCQFLGLRACHSSVAVMQLGITLLMSLIRALLRTQRLKKEDNFMVDDPDFFQGHELDCLALKMAAPDARSWNVCTLPGYKDASPAVDSATNTSSNPTTAGSTATNTPSNSVPGQSNTPTVLKRLPVASGGSTILAGFRIKPQATKRAANEPPKQLEAAVEKELLQWLSTEYCSQCSSKCGTDEKTCCNKDPESAVKALLYRRRLARMTGLGKPESEDSRYWGGKFVSVRDTALILGHAIDDTMKILFASESQPPVTLHDSWNKATAIFWTVRCFLQQSDAKAFKSSGIKMSLRRRNDENGDLEGPWKANRAELEAVLSLWLWSFREPSKVGDSEEAESTMAGQRINRILSAATSPYERLELDMWRGRGAVKIQTHRLAVTRYLAEIQSAMWWRDGDVFYPAAHRKPDISRNQRQLFGWCNLKEPTPGVGHTFSVLQINSNSSLLLNCAQEIYSIFLTAILQAVKDIGGCSTAGQNQGDFTVSNDNVNNIRSALVTRGLCDAEDAFSCTVPVLRNQGKLNPPNDVIVVAGGLADKYRMSGKWNKCRELVGWRVHRSYAELNSMHDLQGTRREMEAVNDLRLSLLATCETYHQALLQRNPKSKSFGCKGITDLIQRYSQDEKVEKIPLVWFDSTTEAVQSTGLSLTDAIISYGEAALWDIQATSDSISSEAQDLKLALRTGINSKSVAPDIDQAIENCDLSSTLFLLPLRPSNEPVSTSMFRSAAQSGWYMVVRNMIRHRVGVDEDSDPKPIALQHASEVGDINMVRTLLEEGANIRKMTPCHVAAKKGHAVVVEDLMKRSSDGPFLEFDADGMTALSWAIKLGKTASVRALLSPGTSVPPNDYSDQHPALHFAIQQGKLDMVDLLLEYDVVNPNHKFGLTVNSPPIVCAVRLKRKSIFDRLVDDARVDMKCTDNDGRTAFWWACALGLESYVNKLIHSGKVRRLDKPDRAGDTPISIAVQAGHVEVLHQLQRLNAASITLRSILIAAQNGHVRLVKELLPKRSLWASIKDSSFWEEERGKKLGDDAEVQKEMEDKHFVETLKLRADRVRQLHVFQIFTILI
ncbi:putative ankyrin repeat protein [Dactylonectria macrodidyma]|uniref:Ankyrin repeat protein n=1 Tax=Dactylonectria macrodidyma TaxID=307937 RepID=A0A9P9INX7_9HYPO|nr:putative ankyrin repeat protein [Dactylonectria macrodidyma]